MVDTLRLTKRKKAGEVAKKKSARKMARTGAADMARKKFQATQIVKGLIASCYPEDSPCGLEPKRLLRGMNPKATEKEVRNLAAQILGQSPPIPADLKAAILSVLRHQIDKENTDFKEADRKTLDKYRASLPEPLSQRTMQPGG